MLDDPLWYKTAVFYELYVRGFHDGDGDGSGDFRGLSERLDYLQWLDIDCIWLLPIYPSPLRDGGYDVSDYFSILPTYGTLGDFYEFLEASHSRGIRVIADLVMNHTSDQHPWFQESRKPGSHRRDWYVWSDTDQRYLDARVIFVDTETSNWTWDSEAQAFYWHRFFSHQPDLNYDNPEVQEAMLEVIRFWLDMGLDGFRLDAVPYLFEREGTNCENLPETHDFLKRVRKEVDSKYEGKLLLAEANQWPPDVVPYFGDGDECHMAFNFPVMPRMFMSLRREDRTPIIDIMNRSPKIPEVAQWGLFLRNHDELTLEMVTDEERDYMYVEYAKDPRMRRNIGIARRLAPLLDNGRRQVELLYSLLFSLPGSPVIYYGDEVGMGDNIYLGDRDGVRTPMHWSSDRNAGFSKADPAALYLPLLMDPVYGFQAVNVEAQERVSTSLLQWLRRLLQVRKQHPVFGMGDYEPLYPENRRVFAFVRQLGSDVVLVVANLSRFAQPVELDLSRWHGLVPEEMFGRTPFPIIDGRPYRLAMGPHGFYWFRLVEPPSETDDTAMFRAIRGSE
ncbi:MAG TPA: maltose alpha-D-glucosyltransferase [Actinomycetes bacterium]|jgi:maltose alpha-D-glucosyltransferase/alpha-amylase|nr:maltose alpha-D-glucosyltransferase [Actinomycetes bacterium]